MCTHWVSIDTLTILKYFYMCISCSYRRDWMEFFSDVFVYFYFYFSYSFMCTCIRDPRSEIMLTNYTNMPIKIPQKNCCAKSRICKNLLTLLLSKQREEQTFSLSQWNSKAVAVAAAVDFVRILFLNYFALLLLLSLVVLLFNVHTISHPRQHMFIAFWLCYHV